MTVIFWFSSRDAQSSTEQSDFFITVFLNDLFDGEIPLWLSVVVRKIAHFTVYAVLGFCLYYSFEGAVKDGFRTLVYPWGISVAYAFSDELHQMFVPGRAGRLFDLAVDSLGALFGIGSAALLLMLIRIIKRKRSCL